MTRQQTAASLPLAEDLQDNTSEALASLQYKATNEPPYPFEWLNYIDTFQDYGAALTRISRTYDTRFG